MLGGYDSPSSRCAAPGEQTQATRTSTTTSSGKRAEETGAGGGGGGKEKRQRQALQTPPRLAAAGAQEEGQGGFGEAAKRPLRVKPIYFVGEYVTDEEEMLVDVNAGGTRFTVPRTALAPLLSTHTVSGVPNPRRLGDMFLDVSPSVFEPLARLLVLPPPTDASGGPFGRHSPCPRPPPSPRSYHLDPLAWHLTLASLGLCRPPSSSEEEEAATAMAMGGVASPTATAAKTGELKGGGEQEEEEGMMAVARDEEEVGATEPWPKSDPLVDIYMETGGPLQTRASTLMQGPAASPIRRGIASRLRHAPLRIFIPGPPACVSLLVDYLRLWAMAASLEVSGGAPPSPCPLPNPPHVPRFLVGDWEAFLSLLGLREWVEGIRTPRPYFHSVVEEGGVRRSHGIEVETQAGPMPRLLLTAPHAIVHAHVGPPIVGKGVHYLRLRPYLTETGGGEMERGAALEGEGPGQGHIKLVMRSMDHPSQRQWTIGVAGGQMDLFPMGEAVVLKADLAHGRLEARRAHGAGTGAGPFSPSAEEAGATAGAAGALTTHAWAMEGKGPLMSPAEHPAPGEGLQLEIEIPARKAGTGTLCVAFERVGPEEYWAGWGNAE